nr:hypothetical protein [uncultured archaeon]AQS29492.1 hypothetical protein [uncultured archaeon]
MSIFRISKSSRFSTFNMAGKNELPKAKVKIPDARELQLPPDKSCILDNLWDWHQRSAHSHHMIGPPNIGREQDYLPSPVSRPAKYKEK